MILSFLGKYREGGLLFLRVGLGILFILHGLHMIAGKQWYSWHSLTVHWHEVGVRGMRPIGMTSYYTLWGALAFFAEFTGGIFFVLGFCFRPAALALAITMTMATIMHVKHHAGFYGEISHAAEMAIVFWGLLFVGPGRYSLDKS